MGRALSAANTVNNSAEAFSIAANDSNINNVHNNAQSDNTEQSEIMTALENNLAETQSFASITTGTIRMDVSPQLLSQLESLRTATFGKDFNKLATFVQTLQHNFPQKDNKLLLLINPTILAAHIPFCDTPQDITDDMLEHARQPIELQDSMASIDGVPVWERLEGERLDYYSAFKTYRDMRYGMLDNGAQGRGGDLFLQNRSMAALARDLCIPGKTLAILGRVYNWPTRCAYFDSYMEDRIQKRKYQEIQMLQNDHLRIASDLVDRASSYLSKNVNKMKPKEVLDMLALGLKYSRVSVGLDGDKPGNGSGAGTPTLAIYNNTDNSKSSQTMNIQANLGNTGKSFSGEVERQLHDDIKVEENLLSILNVLQRSGAMSTAVSQNILETAEKVDNEAFFESAEVVEDADFTDVNNDSPMDHPKAGDLNE